ncbi:MAG: MerR family DNA-binding transcriptional regulator [Propionibacteriaceae bacterium]|nr:MerR family DNA-binding transcriptional regulator [Propionibacteriaceae bacterium]
MSERRTLRAHEIEALREHLDRIPDRHTRASHMTTTTGTPEPGERPAGKPGSRAPLNLAVVHLADTRHKPGWHGLDPQAQAVTSRFGVLPSLELWVRHVRDHMSNTGTTYPPLAARPTVATECRWLADTLTYTLAHEWAPTLADDIRHLDSQLGAILGERPEYRPRCRVLGCQNTDGTRTPLEPHDNATWYACPACGRQYTLAADLKALGQTQPAMTGPEVAQALGLSKHTIRSWASRGLLTHEGRDHKGRKVYDLDLVRRTAQRTREQ